MAMAAVLERYGRFQGDPTPLQLAEYFVLTPRDLQAIADLRFDHTRLGFALQLCTLRFLSTFLLDTTDVPALVLKTLCEQLGLSDATSLTRYFERRTTPFDHQLLIRSHLGYKVFEGLERSQPAPGGVTRFETRLIVRGSSGPVPGPR